MAFPQNEARVALFLDVENLAIHAEQQGVSFRVGPIVDHARGEGRVVVARAYGDFAKPFMSRVLSDLQRSVFELAQLPTDVKGKNTADMLLALDALEMCLQSSAPWVFVVGSGDRDYVPLVQRLRRYGSRVVGVGLKGSISAMLRTVCDDYWYYEDIVQPRTGDDAVAGVQPAARAPEDKLERAIQLCLAIVREYEAGEEPCLASRVCETMSDRDPDFKMRALGYTSFKDFAAELERRGLIKVVTHGTKVTLTAEGLASEMPEPSSAEATSQLANRYRSALEKKRVPLVPWTERRKLVQSLWREFEAAQEGMAIRDMSESLLTSAATLRIDVTQQAVFKMTYTLNLGRCFAVESAPVFVEDIFTQKVFPACDVDDALDRMHVTYVRGIYLDRPDLPLRADAVARLLFEAPTDTQVQLAKDYIRKAETWRDY